MVDLDVISPRGESSARVASFLSLPIGSGGKIAADMGLGGDIEGLNSGGLDPRPQPLGIHGPLDGDRSGGDGR
ncbi:hypothetical protein P0O24_04500 [Methanotrichaceae archaeon M04Ac]|uniref:Uncharacterized protein n=2 Tax=Candidatus Methanocrinis alkalitolerans TaxID=3033395 RepID=A0ABT5XDQ6_9EURY|nr:hypothetical protein [Candidatus Methanocrinis alkalitolerans]